ncbi:MAG TPA: hypothetical protein VF721_06900 [Pyrinomonadaceae bacterium]|jgi:hypothetical protein
MKNPHIQLKEAIFEIEKTAYETDDFFKEMEAQLEEFSKIRDDFAERLKYSLPPARRKLQLLHDDICRKIEDLKEGLQDYLKQCFKEDGRIEIEEPDQEKLDAAFAKADVAHERIYIVYKHLQPHLLEEFTKIATDRLPPEEVEQFFENVKRREAEELDEILASIESDNNALRP